MNISSLPIANIIPGQPELEARLAQGDKLTVYMGIDPTATQIHLGHAVPLRILQHFAEAGHNVKFLIGDFTALIGDTSDKTSERPILTSQEIQQNFQQYKAQASKILDFNLPNIEVLHNSTWLKDLTFEDIIKLCQNFSTGDFISRELIRDRLQSGTRVGLHETLYPVMQGYDMYHLDADLQIGGTDQTYNMQAGRLLQKKLRGKDTFVITTPFLTGTDGHKMSKTSGNAIWLTDTPEDIYGKTMSIPDTLIEEYSRLTTNTQNNHRHPELDSGPQTSEQPPNPMEIKKALAHQITLELHNQAAADTAQAHFESIVQNSQVPEELPTCSLQDLNKKIDESFNNPLNHELDTHYCVDYVAVGFNKSKSDARRLIEQGGFRLNGNQMNNPHTPLPLKPGDILQAGKRNYLKLT